MAVVEMGGGLAVVGATRQKQWRCAALAVRAVLWPGLRTGVMSKTLFVAVFCLCCLRLRLRLLSELPAALVDTPETAAV